MRLLETESTEATSRMSKLAQQVQRLVDELRQKTPEPSRAAVKRQKRETQAEVIIRVRAQVFLLDPACICGECRPSVKDEMNEVVPRSKTRGLPPEERFNSGNCIRMSRRCHRLFHGQLKTAKGLFVRFLDEQRKANGPIELRWKDGRTKIYQRQPAAAAVALTRPDMASASQGDSPSLGAAAPSGAGRRLLTSVTAARDHGRS